MANNNRAGLSIGDSRVAFAHVQREDDGTMQLAASAFDTDTHDDQWPKQLLTYVDTIDLARSQVTSVLPAGSYQLLLVEVPKVPSDEVNAAVLWQIKDLLDFPADDTVIELFEMPDQFIGGNKSMAYAVATRRIGIQEHIDLLQRAGFSLDVIDIPELCTRNVATQIPEDDDGVAFLHFMDNYGILTVTRQGILYLVRRIERGRSALSAASTDDFARTELVSTIVLEIQRSLDFYESNFDRRQLRQLVLAPGSDIGGLANSLNDQLGLTVSALDLNSLVEMPTPVSLEDQGECLLAIGAALRSDSQAV